MTLGRLDLLELECHFYLIRLEETKKGDCRVKSLESRV